MTETRGKRLWRHHDGLTPEEQGQLTAERKAAKKETQELLDVIEASIQQTLNEGRPTNLRVENGGYVADYDHKVHLSDYELRDTLREALKRNFVNGRYRR